MVSVGGGILFSASRARGGLPIRPLVAHTGLLWDHILRMTRNELSVTGLAGPRLSRNVRFEWLHRDSPGRLCQV